jgi:hypothetical protein
MWLAGLAGGALAAPFTWWAVVPPRTRLSATSVVGGTAVTYVDHDGWMLTPEDVAALAARQPAQ